MDSADALLGGLASGDSAPTAADAPAAETAMKRDQDSTDDFEHLDREGKREAGESPHRQPAAAATRSFLDMERELLAEAPRAPSASADHIADKFTDSESDADTAGESPMHRPEIGRGPYSPELPQELGSGPFTPEPPFDPTPALAPASAPAPVPVPSAPVAPEKPLPEEPKSAPEPKPELPKPEPPKPQPVKSEPVLPPKPAAPEPMRPTAHVIEAEVIFCQMGLGKMLFLC